jgi:arylsulfatase A-like enzyme
VRILYIDIDSLRPDHLGCYGYHRQTSPNIDRLAAGGVRFDQCYVTDTPCLPSRTALFSGRCGIHTGVIDHGGVAADPFLEGPRRGFKSALCTTSWMACLRQAGFRTVTVSPFGERHAAWHWYAGFSEMYNTGRSGGERADEVAPVAIDWIRRNGAADNWFLHVNFWDPHSLFATPEAFGRPFAHGPLSSWLTEEVRQQHWQGIGPHSAREVSGFEARPNSHFSSGRSEIATLADVRAMLDGYDTEIRYADHHVGQLLNALADVGVLEETAVIVSADHGQNLGELNVYADHQLADAVTTHIPLIVYWPGVTDHQAGRVDTALHYHIDYAATVIELAGGTVPALWDGVSFAGALRRGNEEGHPFLVLSHGAWSCQRAVRFGDYLLLRSYHDGYHGFPARLLFDLSADPHEQHDLAPERPDLVGQALTYLDDWYGRMMATATHPQDPLWTVVHAGGAFHTRGHLPGYLERLRATDRATWADRLAAAYPREAGIAPPFGGQ